MIPVIGCVFIADRSAGRPDRGRYMPVLTLFLVVVCSLFASACGGRSASDQHVDSLIALDVATSKQRIYADRVSNGADLPAATRAYLAGLRNAVEQGAVDADAARAEIATVAADLDGYCGACARLLEQAEVG